MTALALLSDEERKLPGAEPPMPLFRPDRDPEAYPVAALGDILGGAAFGIMDSVQCPDGIAAQSILGAAALAIQGHVDVVLPVTNHAVPVSLFLVSVAATGERKSAADAEAMRAITAWQRERYDLWNVEKVQYGRDRLEYDIAKKQVEKAKDNAKARAAIEDLPPEPLPPLTPILTSSEPTLEGLLKLLQEGYPSVGIFADEGGSFIGGHGMSRENRLRTTTGLSDLWGGKPINRVRSGEGPSIIMGKRVSLHLMVQPGIARLLLSDEQMRDQGFLSRLLVSAPRSTIGTRLQREATFSSHAALSRYHSVLSNVLCRGLPLRAGTRNVLDPRHLGFSQSAARRWKAYADEVERDLAPGGRLQYVTGLANKLPEHAARIAAVLQCAEDIEADEINLEVLECAICLANYYVGEALRLFGAGAMSPEIAKAEKVRQWLQAHWREPFISVRALQRRGPNEIREKKVVERALDVLQAHQWLVLVEGGAIVDGQRANKAWQIIRMEDE